MSRHEPGRSALSVTRTGSRIQDYFTDPNALGLTPTQRPPVPATVSFEVRWGGAKERRMVRDEQERFAAELVETAATIAWTARQEGFSYVSAPAPTSETHYSGSTRRTRP